MFCTGFKCKLIYKISLCLRYWISVCTCVLQSSEIQFLPEHLVTLLESWWWLELNGHLASPPVDLAGQLWRTPKVCKQMKSAPASTRRPFQSMYVDDNVWAHLIFLRYPLDSNIVNESSTKWYVRCLLENTTKNVVKPSPFFFLPHWDRSIYFLCYIFLNAFYQS